MTATSQLRRNWPWALLPLVGGGLLTVYRYLDGLAYGQPEPLIGVLIKEMGGGLGTVVLLWPLVLLHVRRPLFAPGGWRTIPAHLVGLGAFSALHTTWNWGFRSLLYPLAGLGVYDYGRMPVRYAMELPFHLISYVVAGGVVALVVRGRAARARELQLARLEGELQRARLAQLQAQLRPHFLFNALNTVSSMMYEDVRRADAVLQSLSDLLRRMVDQGEETTVELAEEVRLTSSYLQVMEARFGDRLKTSVNLPPGLGSRVVPPLLLQPIVENAIRHAMAEDGEPLEIRVSVGVHGGALRIDVEDNGPGLNGAGGGTGGGRGVGLSNTRERIAAQFGPEATLELENRRDGGLRVRIELP